MSEGEFIKAEPLSSTYDLRAHARSMDKRTYGHTVTMLHRAADRIDELEAEVEAVYREHHPEDIITECHWCGWSTDD
tara:strand:- start:40 stop:270 length:231 start_codon:yes stop_codon:yes gene_type:complete